MPEIYDFTVSLNSGKRIALSEYRNKVMLIVNTASKCGFTPQYAGLETLYRDFQERGLVVLGFPCNQFGAQEPGDVAEIVSFCSLTYNVSFALFDKIEVNGSHAHPLYKWMKAQVPGLLGSQAIKWNFTKFLVGRDGKIVGRYAPMTKPEAMRRNIEALL